MDRLKLLESESPPIGGVRDFRPTRDQIGPDLYVRDHVDERSLGGLPADIEFLMELLDGELLASAKELTGGPLIVAEQAIEQVHHVPRLEADLAGDGPFQEALDFLDRDAVDHRAEEAFDDQLLRFGARDTTRLEIEDVLRHRPARWSRRGCSARRWRAISRFGIESARASRLSTRLRFCW